MPGTRVEGTLELVVPEPIPRAERIDLVFKTDAWAGYGSGKNRRVETRTIFLAPLRVALPHGVPLAAGSHRFPFAVDLPPFVPPALTGQDCGIKHGIDVRLDVDWAFDPTGAVLPDVRLPPGEGSRTPLVTRTPPSFHDRIVLEVTMPSSTLVLGADRAEGQIALRAGAEARFDAVLVSVASLATIGMARGDQRRGFMATTRIPAAMLRDGKTVRFAIPLDRFQPTFRSGFIDHDLALIVTADVPWGFDPELAIPLHVFPHGSILSGSAGAAPIGSERIRRHAAAMASATGLTPGRNSPVLVEGNVGPVQVRLDDAPADGQLGVTASFTFPDVELACLFRPLGMLDGFRESPLLPAPLGNRFLLRVEPRPGRPAFDAQAVAPFFEATLGGLAAADEVSFGDHHLRLHLRLPNDGSAEMVALAEAICARARYIGEAIKGLPWPEPAAASAPAWQAVAMEESAVLVPSGPALHGLGLASRVLGGEIRTMRFAVRTDWRKGGPVTRVDVDLREAPLPKGAGDELEGVGRDLLAPVRGTFDETHAIALDHVTLERTGLTADPRTLWSALEALFDWVLDVRGERRAQHAYR